MKKHIITLCAAGLCAGSLAACNDFDNPAIPYDEAPEAHEALTPPTIDPSWNLQLIPDEGVQDPSGPSTTVSTASWTAKPAPGAHAASRATAS